MKMFFALIPILATTVLTQPSSCNKSCKATISVTAQRTQTSTVFTITGKNFAAGKNIKITITNRPEPLSTDPWSCGAVAISNAVGDFTATCEVGYMGGNDTGTRNPYFAATDGECAGVQTVLSAYWFAN